MGTRAAALPVLLFTLLAGEPGQARLAIDPGALVARIPPRPEGALTGSEFIRSVAGLSPTDREARIFRELASGNLPDYLRQLRSISLESTVPGRGTVRAQVWVMPDYLAIGSDDDFVRIPMAYYTAVALCREWGFILPTRKIVNATYRQADVRLSPSPMTPGPLMRSSTYYLTHNRTIEAQLAGSGVRGLLVAGHKKDLVLTNRLWTRRARVAIYGWHQGKDKIIQPLSTVHSGTYSDYSHGVRLVSEWMAVNDRERSIITMLQDPNLARLITAEGTIRNVEGLMNLPPPKGWALSSDRKRD